LSLLTLLVALAAAERIFITSIVPNIGPTTGNTRVLVRGTHLEPREDHPSPKCKFGSKKNIVKATYVTCTPIPRRPDEPEPTTAEKTAHCIECDPSPESPVSDMVPFSVSITGDFTDVENSAEFQYYPPPKVNYIVPIYGPKNGGTVVTVYGENFIDFDQYLRCSFGTKAVPGIYISSTMMYCVSPFSDTVVAGMPFRITLNDQQNTKEDIKYYYYPEPAIMKLTPDKGPTTGGTVVMIEGQDLDPFNDVLSQVNNHNDTYCRFGNDFLTPATIYSDILISCVAPPSPIIRTVLVDVTLNNADMILNPGSWTDDHLPYTYYAPAYVYDCNPRVGPTSGNTSVYVSGSNFNDTGSIKCRFGSKVVSGRFLSVNEILCLSPAVDNPGLVDLSVSLIEDNFGQSVKYLYYATPWIDSIQPMCGPTTGYTQITVIGKNFVFTGPNLVFCIFGDSIFTPATVMSDTEIKCDSPDIHLDDKLVKQTFFNVSVTLNGKDRSQSKKPIIFGFYQFHKLFSMTPTSGPITGNTTAILHGEHFAQPGVCNVTVRFGTTEVLTFNHTDTVAVAMSPSVKVPGDAIVQLSLNGQQFTDQEGTKNIGGSKFDEGVLGFYFYQDPLVTDFKPKQGPKTGNATVVVYGAGFLDAEEDPDDLHVLLRFNYTNGTYIGTGVCYDVQLNQAKCWTPAAKAGTKAYLEITKNGVNFLKIRNTGSTADDDTYLFYEAPVIIDIDPKFGPVKYDEPRNLTVNGTNFKCISTNCDELTCRYGTKPYPIYTKGYLKDDKHIICEIPNLSRPEAVEVEITLNGNDYTNDHKFYTYYDAFVLDVVPKFGKREGGTNVSAMGFGFADTGSELECKFGSKENPLLCKFKDCIVKAKFISDTEVQCTTFAQSDIVYKNTGEPVGDEGFDVEVAVRDRKFTNSHNKFRYFKEPTYKGINPDRGSSSGGSYIVTETDFHWKSENNTDGNNKEFIEKYIIVKCKFTGKNQTVVVEGNIITYPFHSHAPSNAITCLSPPWSGIEDVKIDLTINGKDYSGNFTFKYEEKLEGMKITPACGINGGETKITILGTGFNDLTNLHLKWGTESRPANLETLFSPSSGVMTGYSAPTPTKNTHGGFVYVEIGHNIDLEDNYGQNYTFYGDYTSNKLLYFYYKEPVIKYIFPHGGPNTGGTEVTLAGAWYINYPSMGCTPLCRFGEKVVPGEFISTVRVKCISPAQPGLAAAVPLDVSFNGVDWTNGEQIFVYYNVPFISYILPVSGPSTGGTMVGVYGSNFTGQANADEFLCRFRSVSINAPDKFIHAFFKNESLIYCTSPGGWGSGTEARVDITFNGIDYTSSNSSFFFFQVDGARPLSGPNTGSSKGITIFGSGFIPNPNAACVLDYKEYKPIAISWNYMICPMPTSVKDDFVGEVTFEITMNGVDYRKFEHGFRYYRQANVSSVEPDNGPVSGGSLITIYGGPFKSDFEQANLTCRIGEFASHATKLSDNVVQCLTPPMERPKNGTQLIVSVAINGQDYAPSNHTYSVYGLLDSAPKGGPIAGGTEVMLRGYGFKNTDPRCRFGIDSVNLVVQGKVIDDSHMICVSPTSFKIPDGSQLPLDVPLEIGFSEAKYHPWTHTDNKFRFYDNPKILSIVPSYGWVDQRYELNITADEKQGFFPAITGWKSSGELDVLHAIVCRFGKYGTVPAVYVSKTSIKCVTPETKINRKDLHEDSVTVEIALNGQDYFKAGSYTFKGTATGLWLVLMWLGMVILAVAIVILLGVCCYYLWNNISMPKINFNFPQMGGDNAGRQASVGGRPHVFRGDDGVVRPRASPANADWQTDFS